jgi:hypothetical protein
MENQLRLHNPMRSVQDIMREGNGIKVLSRKDVGEAVRAAKAKKTEFTSFWTRKRGKATK